MNFEPIFNPKLETQIALLGRIQHPNVAQSLCFFFFMTFKPRVE